MKITSRGRYAVMALVSLASSSRGNPVPIQAIARQESIPEPYLQQLFLRLKRKNLVKSVRGPGGGFLLARHPSAITVGEVIRTAEGKADRVGCRKAGRRGSAALQIKKSAFPRRFSRKTLISWETARDGIQHMV